uniref:lanC-like protein 3 isoform X1 n=1 Tax=Ciona intestinalis TaxID=7719 RepID=UPI00006A5D07|nr:lanC-like protein 3 isoform X1 [Ciona intestinalis]|eukprot:XP_026696073.1 lanC-like protein 3 isoform X1 [Ciona intestinalis]
MSHARYFENPFLGMEPTYKDTTHEDYKSRVIEMVDKILHNLKPTPANGKGGIYVGTAGIAYMFYYLARSGLYPDHKERFLNAAKSYIESALEYDRSNISSKRKQIGFLHGEGGVHAVAALVFYYIGDKKASDKHLKVYQSSSLCCKDAEYDELFVGRAGYLLGVLLLQRHLKTEVLPSKEIDKIFQKILKTGKKFRSKLQLDGDIPLMFEYHGKMYLGAAHGFSGILQVLLCFPQLLNKDGNTLTMIQQSVDYLLSRCVDRDGNFNVATNLQSSLSQDGGKHLVHWCHGAAGVIYTFAKAYFVFGKDPKYLEACVKLGETVWKLGLLKKGPGICHGVAGSGYVFLLLYRLTGDTKYLYRAHKFANFIFSPEFKSAHQPDRPFSLFEGIAGTVCFLNDLMEPNKAEFPLSDVFLS